MRAFFVLLLIALALEAASKKPPPKVIKVFGGHSAPKPTPAPKHDFDDYDDGSPAPTPHHFHDSNDNSQRRPSTQSYSDDYEDDFDTPPPTPRPQPKPAPAPSYDEEYYSDDYDVPAPAPPPSKKRPKPQAKPAPAPSYSDDYFEDDYDSPSPKPSPSANKKKPKPQGQKTAQKSQKKKEARDSLLQRAAPKHSKCDPSLSFNKLKENGAFFFRPRTNTCVSPGLAYGKEGNLEGANECFGYAAELEPENEKIWTLLGEIALYGGNHALAQEYGNKCLEVNPDSTDGHFILGNVAMGKDKVLFGKKAIRFENDCSLTLRSLSSKKPSMLTRRM